MNCDQRAVLYIYCRWIDYIILFCAAGSDCPCQAVVLKEWMLFVLFVIWCPCCWGVLVTRGCELNALRGLIKLLEWNWIWILNQFVASVWCYVVTWAAARLLLQDMRWFSSLPLLIEEVVCVCGVGSSYFQEEQKCPQWPSWDVTRKLSVLTDARN